MRTQFAPKIVKRLLTADGYMDLGLPERAVEELEKITDAGLLEGPRHLLHGVALRQLELYADAIMHLEKAARLMPSPARRFAWKELEICYRGVGSDELSAMAQKLAGIGEFELRIALPGSSVTLDFCKSESQEAA